MSEVLFNRYIIRLESGTDPEDFLSDHNIPEDDINAIFRHSILGCSLTLSGPELEPLALDDRVVSINLDSTPDTDGSYTQDLFNFPHTNVVDPYFNPLNTRVPSRRSAKGVTIYALDRGISVAMTWDYFSHVNFVGYANQDTVDASDTHGIRVMDVMVGRNGFARDANIYWGEVASTTAWVSACDEFILDYQTRGGPAVFTTSLAWPDHPDSVIDDATASLVDAGIVAFASGGNSNIELLPTGQSPARDPSTITVSGYSPVTNNRVATAYGPLVDIYAPATNFVLRGHPGNTAIQTIAPTVGTSFGTPLAASVAANMLHEEPELTPAEVRQRLIDMSIKDVITPMPEGSHNRMLSVPESWWLEPTIESDAAATTLALVEEIPQVVGKVRSNGEWVDPTIDNIFSGGTWGAMDVSSVAIRQNGSWVLPG